jgi:hypothetical protein
MPTYRKQGRPSGLAGAMNQETSMTSKLIQSTSFLRRVLLADAGISAAVGALMAAGADRCSV